MAGALGKASAYEAARRAQEARAAQADAWARFVAFSRLRRRPMALAIAQGLALERSRPEHDRSHGPGPTDGTEVPDDGQAKACGEANQIHGGHGAADRGARK